MSRWRAAAAGLVVLIVASPSVSPAQTVLPDGLEGRSADGAYRPGVTRRLFLDAAGDLASRAAPPGPLG